MNLAPEMLSPMSKMGRRFLFFLKIGIILCGVAWAVFYSLAQAVNLPVQHIDGAFQTASGLYRLDAGQFPGRDFLPYLGVGPLFILYPFFEWFGANLAASVIATHLTCLLFALLSTGFIFHLVWRPKSFLTSMVISTLLILTTGTWALVPNCPAIEKLYCVFRHHIGVWRYVPGHSLRPIRAALPYLSAIVLYFFILRIHSTRLKYLSAGILAGFVLLWSNDFSSRL